MAGRPNELFYLSDLHGGVNRLQAVPAAQIHEVYDNCADDIETSDCRIIWNMLQHRWQYTNY